MVPSPRSTKSGSGGSSLWTSYPQAAGQNLYAYAGQNPFLRADPSGLKEVPTEGPLLPLRPDTHARESYDLVRGKNLLDSLDIFVDRNYEAIGLEEPKKFSRLNNSLQISILRAILELHHKDIGRYRLKRRGLLNDEDPVPEEWQVEAMARANLQIQIQLDLRLALAFALEENPVAQLGMNTISAPFRIIDDATGGQLSASGLPLPFWYFPLFDGAEAGSFARGGAPAPSEVLGGFETTGQWPRERGKLAESVAADELTKGGHTIVGRNVYIETAEGGRYVDILTESVDDAGNYVYTAWEVKYGTARRTAQQRRRG